MVAERRVGVLGGTCNPVHLGHLIIAEEARAVLGLDRVLFVPAGQPWMKEQGDLAAKEDRWEMVLRATGPDRHFEASRIDLDRDGPSYAVDTLRELRAGCQAAPEYFFILGLDALAGLASWKEPEALLGMCRLAVAARPGLDKVAALDSLRRGAAEPCRPGRFPGSSPRGHQRQRHQAALPGGKIDPVPRPPAGRGLYPGERTLPLNA